VDDAPCDPEHEVRRVALRYLADARAELVEEIEPRVAAERRTQIVERIRSGSRPIWTVSVVCGD
jgi:hypothetical protein